jgi:hypothetical protein
MQLVTWQAASHVVVGGDVDEALLVSSGQQHASPHTDLAAIVDGQPAPTRWWSSPACQQWCVGV